MTLSPGARWTLKNESAAPVRFHWVRKAYEAVEGIEVPEAFITSDDAVKPTAMPGTDGKWATTRFADPNDIRHDMHVNIVTFEPGVVDSPMEEWQPEEITAHLDYYRALNAQLEESYQGKTWGYPVAIEAIGLNAAANGVSLTTRLGDMIGSDAGWQVIFAGDVCYEREMSTRVFDWLKARRDAAMSDLALAAREVVCLAGIQESFGNAADRVLGKLTGLRLSESTVERTTEAAGSLCKAQRERGLVGRGAGDVERGGDGAQAWLFDPKRLGTGEAFEQPVVQRRAADVSPTSTGSTLVAATDREEPPMSLVLKDGTSWAETYRRCMQVAPEAFDSDRIRNLIAGEWVRSGTPGDHRTPVDGTEIEGPPRIDHPEAERAVDGAVRMHHEWAKVGLDERRERVSRAVAAMREHRDLLALLLVWEIGKPWRLACADVDRSLDGVDWYVAEADRQLAGRVFELAAKLPLSPWHFPEDQVSDDWLFVVEPEIRSILTVPRTGLLSLSALLTIWSAMGGVDSVRVGLNRAYDIRETRSLWWLYFQNVLFVIGSAIFLLIFALLIVFAPVMIQVAEIYAPALKGHFVTIEQLRYPIGITLLTAGVLFCHRVLPAKTLSVLEVLPGVVITVVAWVIMSSAFSESEKARNHSVPSGSACWHAIGRDASVPPSSWTVVSMAVRWSLIRSCTCSAPLSWWDIAAPSRSSSCRPVTPGTSRGRWSR